jgi:hypothetical protein
MNQPTPYQYVKLGSNLEFLRGICTISIMQTTSLAAFPNLLENLPPQRYAVLRVVEAIRALLVQLEEMNLRQSLQVAEAFRPMLAEMENYLARVKTPQTAYLTDPFAQRLVGVTKHVALAVRSELGTMAAHESPLPSGEG